MIKDCKIAATDIQIYRIILFGGGGGGGVHTQLVSD